MDWVKVKKIDSYYLVTDFHHLTYDYRLIFSDFTLSNHPYSPKSSRNTNSEFVCLPEADPKFSMTTRSFT